MLLKKLTKLIFAIFIIIGIFFGIKLSIQKSNPENSKNEILENVFQDVQDIEVEISKTYTYGKAINIFGKLENISKDNFENAKLVVRDGKGYEKSYNLNYVLEKETKTLYFSTDNNMNNGVVLDELDVGEYYLLLRIKTNNSINPKFYSLMPTKALKEEMDIEYYSVSKDGKSKKIIPSYEEIKYKDENITYLSLKVEEADCPENVYDIVIDAGHGGKDSGEVKDGVSEANVVLEYAEKLKTLLEEKGYRVKLTRDSENTNTYTTTNMYDDNGRITIANESNAKLMISLHINNDQNAGLRGIEVYSPPKSNLDFAKVLAKNIVENTPLEFSNNNSYKKADGVYVRNFYTALIKTYEERANKAGYAPYNINTDTPYLYTIREVGGIATNAFVDGRNTSYGANKYVKSCMGIECYQIELGYIKNDLDIIRNDMDKICEQITKTINENY